MINDNLERKSLPSFLLVLQEPLCPMTTCCCMTLTDPDQCFPVAGGGGGGGGESDSKSEAI